MDIKNRIKSAIAGFNSNKVVNSSPDPNAFLKYGHRRMPSTWSTPEITDQDFYTGYGFAVINKRANRAVTLGKNFVYTDAKEQIVKKANDDGIDIVHPYINLIKDSVDFAERDFWYDISTYLDLEGVYYLMAVRTVSQGGRVGNIQKFTLLNPYNVRKVVNSKGELGGYIENDSTKGQRNIPKEMIIPIRLLNPFDQEKTFGLADAARDSQFTMKQANDFAREAIDGNLNAPGILSSAIELPDDQFDNFVSRVKNHGRGEPLFGNGAGTVSWVDMQTDLDKAALDKINSINRDTLLAVSGTSKTGVGVEESGTGREVSRTQKDDFTENAVMPQIENIIDALNLDYRRYYSVDYLKNGYHIALSNPLETNKDAEQADVDIRDSQFALAQSLVSKGYSYDIASKYAKGLISITEIGEPTVDMTPEEPEEPEEPETPEEPTDPEEPEEPVEPQSYLEKSYNTYEGYAIPVVQYLEELGEQIIPKTEKVSVINSTEEELSTVRINHIDEMNNNLIAVVDQNTYITLAEFTETADRVAILSKLNKRYKNQPVAIKKKLNLTHEHSNEILEKIKNASFDKQEQIDMSTNGLLGSVFAAENQLLDEYLNSISAGEYAPGADLEAYINGLALPFAVWFTVMLPIFSSYRVQETATDLGVTPPIFAMNEDIKASINDFARKEATSHMNTIRNDINNALTIIRTQTSDPEVIKQMLQSAFIDIQKRRALLIASNAANRIFALSQYEADLQVLKSNDLIGVAYKEMFSTTGSPCKICASIIATTNENPTPFTSAFVELGDTIESDGLKMNFDFEQIMAGNVHPNCQCAYRIIIKENK